MLIVALKALDPEDEDVLHAPELHQQFLSSIIHNLNQAHRDAMDSTPRLCENPYDQQDGDSHVLSDDDHDHVFGHLDRLLQYTRSDVASMVRKIVFTLMIICCDKDDMKVQLNVPKALVDGSYDSSQVNRQVIDARPSDISITLRHQNALASTPRLANVYLADDRILMTLDQQCEQFQYDVTTDQSLVSMIKRMMSYVLPDERPSNATQVDRFRVIELTDDGLTVDTMIHVHV